MTVRNVTAADAEALAAIYAPYVEETAVSFEYTAPGAEEFRARIARISERYPYLLAEEAGEILGYAYAGPFRSREAYRWTVEMSVYVRRDARRKGVGRALYEALERRFRAQNIRTMVACVAFTEEPDRYLTRDSVAFHEKMGYRAAGRLRQCGCKFGRWYDILWMEKAVGPHGPDPAPVRPPEDAE